jgi:hypothetical protein
MSIVKERTKEIKTLKKTDDCPIGAARKVKTYTVTIDGMDAKLENAIVEYARLIHKSREETAREVFENAMTEIDANRRHFAQTCGIWTDEDMREFEETLAWSEM